MRKKAYVTDSGTAKGLNTSQLHRHLHPDVMEVQYDEKSHLNFKSS